MHFPQLLVAGLVPAVASARALSRRAVDCSFTTSPSSGDKCDSFASSWGLTVDDLKAMNPGISCPNLDTSKFYCVIGTVTGEPEPTTTTTTTTAPTVTNEPAMPGIVDDCDGFYKVSPGDECDTIATEHGISKAQFLEWNTSVNDRKSTYFSRVSLLLCPFPMQRQTPLSKGPSLTNALPFSNPQNAPTSGSTTTCACTFPAPPLDRSRRCPGSSAAVRSSTR
jgi:hypothetical protein